MPAVRDAVETGQISVANARALVRASGKTSASQVDGDAELLEKAAELSPEQFAGEAEPVGGQAPDTTAARGSIGGSGRGGG